MALIFFVVIFLVISGFGETTFPISKHGCDDHCGNVSIPFPFGTREGCYLNDAFFISCRKSSDDGTILDPPQAFVRNGNIEVTNISPEGQLRLLSYVGYDCYEDNVSSKRSRAWMSLRDPFTFNSDPFTFNSTANKFTVVGCDTSSFVTGYLTGERDPFYATGCIAMCYSEEDVVDGSCSGIGCCQTSIPRGAWKINVTVDSYYNHRYVADFNPCSFGFVVETNAFQFKARNLTNLKTVARPPVLVDWVIEYKNCSVAQKNSTSYACSGQNSVCYDEDGALGYRCKCRDGYEGNPYLSNGCQDINECEDHSMSNCAPFSTCVNTTGNYSCNCKDGYHGDGRKVDGCIADKSYWPIFAGVGVSTCTMVVLACTICLYFELTRRKTNRMREQLFKKNGGLILQQKLKGQGGGSSSYNTRIFTDEELKKATTDFNDSQILGKGGFGTVFRGELTDKTVVAVKKSRGVDQNQVEQFINEVIILSQINNRHVVKLLGCCLETEAPLLVYEFIDNGTLYEHLHSRLKASKLNWSIRLRIASEIAGVLSYLHSIASPPIIHRDIKSSNILLDHNYTAKVSDFGTSRLIEMDENKVATVVQGTHGYLDPEYLQTGMLTEKSDVYSFGVVLVELLTGRRVLAHDKPEAERFLSHQFLLSLKEGKLVHMLDTNICCIENIGQLKELANIAKCCLSVNGEDRPKMRDIERDIGALAKIARQLVAHNVEIDLAEDDALLGLQSNVRSDSIGDIPTFGDLYPVSYTGIQEMVAISGGR